MVKKLSEFSAGSIFVMTVMTLAVYFQRSERAHDLMQCGNCFCAGALNVYFGVLEGKFQNNGSSEDRSLGSLKVIDLLLSVI